MGNRTTGVAAPEVHLGQVQKLRLLLPLHMAVAEEHVDAVDVRLLTCIPRHAREVFIVGPASRAMVVAPGTIGGVVIENIAHEQTAGFKAVGGQVLQRSAPDLAGIHLVRNVNTPPVGVLVLKEVELPEIHLLEPRVHFCGINLRAHRHTVYILVGHVERLQIRLDLVHSPLLWIRLAFIGESYVVRVMHVAPLLHHSHDLLIIVRGVGNDGDAILFMVGNAPNLLGLALGFGQSRQQ